MEQLFISEQWLQMPSLPVICPFQQTISMRRDANNAGAARALVHRGCFQTTRVKDISLMVNFIRAEKGDPWIYVKYPVLASIH
jgi:hypothetical protein